MSIFSKISSIFSILKHHSKDNLAIHPEKIVYFQKSYICTIAKEIGKNHVIYVKRQITI